MADRMSPLKKQRQKVIRYPICLLMMVNCSLWLYLGISMSIGDLVVWSRFGNVGLKVVVSAEREQFNFFSFLLVKSSEW